MYLIGDVASKALKNRYNKPFLTAQEISLTGFFKQLSQQHSRGTKCALDKRTHTACFF